LTFNFSNDGLVYAADRAGNRIHVTDKQGNFKQEIKMAENTGVGGSTGGVMFSNDREQKVLYISDLTNNHVWILDRMSGKVLGTLAQMGENAGTARIFERHKVENLAFRDEEFRGLPGPSLVCFLHTRTFLVSSRADWQRRWSRPSQCRRARRCHRRSRLLP
jgi:hypothetical protein